MNRIHEFSIGLNLDLKKIVGITKILQQTFGMGNIHYYFEIHCEGLATPISIGVPHTGIDHNDYFNASRLRDEFMTAWQTYVESEKE